MSRLKLLSLALLALVATTALLGYSHRHAVARHARALLSATVPVPSEGGLLAPGDSVAVSVAAGDPGHPISAFIYGVAKRDPAAIVGLGVTVNRWGGNPSSRFNWTIGHAWNAGDDWEFRNLNYGASGSESDRFVAGDRAQGAASLITIPALGWVAASDHNSDQSVKVPAHGGPAINAEGAIAGYDPVANRRLTSVASLPRKPGQFVLNPSPGAPVYQDEWVNHLVRTFGSAASGGVRFYSVDNESMLWSETHRDVHPAELSYDALLATFSAYADAIKDVDPAAEVVGPDSSGWTDYFYSALDRGPDNFATHSDQARHAGTALTPWFLSALRTRDQAAGRRSLDVLGVHFYPEARGVADDRSSPTLDALRLRSTRALWDPSYTDESWIKKPVMLIPRLKQWVATSYPDTRIGITEYNFGGGNSASSGLAQAEALGIFGREGVYLATYWTAPKPNSPAWFAFRMYRNYDGRGSAFGDLSLPVRSTSTATVSAFASREPGWIDVMLVNKDLGAGHEVRLSLEGAIVKGPLQIWEYGAAGSQIQRLGDLPAGSSALQLPAGAVALVRLPV